MRHQEARLTAKTRPVTLALPTLPLITQITAGLSGVWVVAGETTAGKTTFARHLAYSVVGPELRVAYLDTEGHFLNRIANDGILACHGPEVLSNADQYMDVFLSSTEFREHVDGLKDRALLVIDHLQLDAERGAKGSDPFHSLAAVMSTAVDWASRGHLVLALSQVARASYGSKAPTKAIFKGNSAIEDAAHLGAALWRPEKGNESLIQFRVVKTRFVQMPESAVDMVRDGWSLREVGLSPVGEERRSMAPRRKLQAYEKAIVKVYRQTDALPHAALVKAIGKSKATGKRWIATALASGLLDKDAEGLYRLKVAA